MNAAMKYACNYAVLRFLPYPETNEFVNIGVAVHCPAIGIFNVEIENRKTARVTDFFPELDRESYKTARQAFIEEIKRVRNVIIHEKDVALGRKVFQELVRPRETVFRFGEIRTALTVEPAKLTEQLFAQYVHRHFAQHKEYQETVMAQRFYKALQEMRPNRVFHRDKIVGTKEYHVRIPISSDWRSRDDVPMRAIKPLDLARAEPTALIEHGDAWIQRVKRLKAIQHLPERFIFAYRLPQDPICVAAAEGVLRELETEGSILVPENETKRLLELAAD